MQKFCSFLIIFDFFRGAVLGAVKLHNELDLVTIEISNIAADYILPVETRIVMA